MQHQDFVILCYAVGTFLAVAFAAYAFWYGRLLSKKAQNTDTEAFLTARGTQSIWRIGWSFYAGAVGAWVIVAPSQYAQFSGIVGVVVYAVATGIPILLIGFFGHLVTRDMPHVFSISDFVGWRFGPVAKLMVFLICMFNMSIALLAEYTTIGAIFSDFVGSVSYIIIIIIGVLTLLYTAYGGLAVSIATDQVQGIASMLLAVLVTIYVAVTFKQPIPSPLPPESGPNEAGYVAIFTLTASLIASTMYSEAVWQRVWASANKRALYGGAVLGCSAIILLVFLSGFGGWLAFATGRAVYGETNPNTYLMQVFGQSTTSTNRVDMWVDVLVVLLAIIMNEGAVDSLQNGLAASISGHFLKNCPLKWTRLAVILLNVPLVIIATRGFAVLSLFLVGNLLTCCAIIPLIAGLIPCLKHRVSETAFVLSCVGGVLAVTASGIGLQWLPGDVATSFSYGAFWAWYDNYYDWRQFVAALAGSFATLLLCCLLSWAVHRSTGFKGPGVSGILMRIPGMKYLTATPHWPQPEHAGPSLPTWKDADQVPGQERISSASNRQTISMHSTDGVIVCGGGSASSVCKDVQ